MWKNIRRFQPKPNTQSKRIDMFHRNNKVLSPIETTASYEAPPAITYTSDKVIAQLIIDKIIEKNGKGSNIYGVTGAATYYANDIIQNAVNSGDLNYIHASNESAGVYMAAYEAEINGTVGIHFCTAGPGTAMATTAIGSLFNETKPCIIFFGVPTNNFQYIDQQIMSCITKKVIYINIYVRIYLYIQIHMYKRIDTYIDTSLDTSIDTSIDTYRYLYRYIYRSICL
jgi:hypothetical protein